MKLKNKKKIKKKLRARIFIRHSEADDGASDAFAGVAADTGLLGDFSEVAVGVALVLVNAAVVGVLVDDDGAAQDAFGTVKPDEVVAVVADVDVSADAEAAVALVLPNVQVIDEVADVAGTEFVAVAD